MLNCDIHYPIIFSDKVRFRTFSRMAVAEGIVMLFPNGNPSAMESCPIYGQLLFDSPPRVAKNELAELL
jgi:hypothetical protein